MKQLGLIGLIVLLAFAMVFGQTAATNAPNRWLPGAQFMGMTAYNLGAVVTQPAVQTGANNDVTPTICRTWDGSSLNLDVIATSRGTYTWTNLDSFMNKCNAAGGSLIFTYGLIPSWATGTSTSQCHNGGHNGACDPPTDWNTVAACQGSLTGTITDNCQVREMIKDLLVHATANGTTIKFIELGNETNFCLSTGTEASCHATSDVEFNGTITQYRAITNAIISTARAVQPSIKLIGPAVASMNAQACGTAGLGQTWANLYYASPAPAVDFIGFHGYTSSFGVGGITNAENIDSMIGTFVDVTDASGTTHTTCTNVAAVYNGGAVPLADTEDSWGSDVMGGEHVTSVARSANVTTVITSAATGILTGATVVLPQVDGCPTGAPWNGTFASATVSGTSITYANTGTSQTTCNPTNNVSIIDQQYLQLQADFLARRLLLEYSWGLKFKIWYTFYSTTSQWGNLCGAYSSSGCQDSRPARIAWGEIYKWIAAVTPSSKCSKSGTRWTCDYVRSDGYKSEAVWNTAGSSSYTYPVGYNQSRDLTGAVTLLTPTTVTISATPILLESYAGRGAGSK